MLINGIKIVLLPFFFVLLEAQRKGCQLKIFSAAPEEDEGLLILKCGFFRKADTLNASSDEVKPRQI